MDMRQSSMITLGSIVSLAAQTDGSVFIGRQCVSGVYMAKYGDVSHKYRCGVHTITLGY